MALGLLLYGPSTAQVSYAYDPVDRLTARNSASTQAYDAASQLCWSKTAVVANPSCASVPTSVTKYSYDTRGNRTVKTPPTGTATTYGYDESNHLTSVSGAATYAYDGDGVRLSKTLTGKAATRMVWDRSAAIPNLLGDGASTYIYGPDGAPLEQITSAGVVTFLHHDQLGSTRLITSTAGANVGSYTFDPYGTQTAKTGTATTPFGFAGQYTDAETGLIYMRARYYDPATGTFTAQDPIGSLGSGQNLYGYVGGDPVNAVDPSGLYGFSNLWDDLSGTITEMPGTAWDMRGSLSTGLAAAACIAFVEVCGVAGAISFAVNLQQNLASWRSGKLCKRDLIYKTIVGGAIGWIGYGAKSALTSKELGANAVGRLAGTRLGQMGVRAPVYGSLGFLGVLVNEGDFGGCC